MCPSRRPSCIKQTAQKNGLKLETSAQLFPVSVLNVFAFVQESQLLHDQLQASRQLTEQKVYEPDSDDDEDSEPATSEGFALLKASADTKDNPWLLGNKGQSPKGTVLCFI